MTSFPLTLVVLAAGRSTRYGTLKQLDPIGPGDTALLEYSLFDAARAGFDRFVVVIQGDLEPDFSGQLSPARESGLDIRFVHQPEQDPEWRMVRRAKPWGTGFAVLAGRKVVEGPFGVCNADDFYGRAAFRALARGLRGKPVAEDALLVSYPLADTLSEEGGVSRGLCRRADGQRLGGIREALELVAHGDQVKGVDVAGVPLAVAPDTPVSMNLWGFRPDFMVALGACFTDFLKARPGESDEFYLSEAVGRLLTGGRMQCRLIEAGVGWLGVTFPNDRERVASSLASLVDSGVYPPSLWVSQ
ncbi:MAG: nucleotidyltransferase family protein [Longimicrobiales bacterium]